MNFLYISDISPGWVNTTQMRIKVLKRLGMQIHPICIRPYTRWGGRWGGAIFRQTLWGPPVLSLNRTILARAAEIKPDVVWVGKGRHVFPETLQELKRRWGSLLVHYTPDAAFHFRGNLSRHFERCVPVYDLLVTTKSYELKQYQECGAQELLLQYPTFDEELHRPMTLTLDEQRRYSSDVAFLGTYGPGKSRDKFLAPLEGLQIDLGIWGQYWTRRCKHPYLRQCVRGVALCGPEYAKAICASKIGLGLLQKNVPDRNTTRSVEIPATGTFLLAERTDDHLSMFDEGKEAEFFETQQEVTEKVSFYLKHPAARRRIAEAGRERCFKSGYTSRQSLLDVLGRIETLRSRTTIQAA